MAYRNKILNTPVIKALSHDTDYACYTECNWEQYSQVPCHPEDDIEEVKAERGRERGGAEREKKRETQRVNTRQHQTDSVKYT